MQFIFRKIYQQQIQHLPLVLVQTKVKKRLHQEFLLINIDTIINQSIKLIIQTVFFIVTHRAVIQIYLFLQHATNKEGNIAVKHPTLLYHQIIVLKILIESNKLANWVVLLIVSIVNQVVENYAMKSMMITFRHHHHHLIQFNVIQRSIIMHEL